MTEKHTMISIKRVSKQNIQTGSSKRFILHSGIKGQTAHRIIFQLDQCKTNIDFVECYFKRAMKVKSTPRLLVHTMEKMAIVCIYLIF